MTELLQSDLATIRAHPLTDAVKDFCTAFTSKHMKDKNADISEIVDELTSQQSNTDTEDTILDLITTLQFQPAAATLRSKSENGALRRDIAFLAGRLTTSQVHLRFFGPLLKLVLTRQSDADIWAAVLNLIAQTKPVTPPPPGPAFLSSFQQTPASFNTSGLINTSEHREQVNGVLKQELTPSLRLDVTDLEEALFRDIPRLDERAEDLFHQCQLGDAPLYKDGTWVNWPQTTAEQHVLQWLRETVKALLRWAEERGCHTSRRIYEGPGIYLSGSLALRRMDVGITDTRLDSYNDAAESDSKTSNRDWTRILVVGELKSNPDEDNQSKAWIDLATYAREVFRAQDRRFVLGFTLCGRMMRLWQFDRLGNCGSVSFDIHDGYKFVQTILAFHLMSDAQLGLDTTIRHVDNKSFVQILRNGQNERLILTKCIKRQAVIVGRATTCWKAHLDGDSADKTLIVKDSWQFTERPEEGDILKDATQKGVQNVARYYHHETVEFGGMDDGVLMNIRGDKMKAWSRKSFQQKSAIKPKATDPDAPGKLLSGRSSSSSLTQLSPSKRSRSSQRSTEKDTTRHDRIHRRVITRDAGKPIYEGTSLSAIVDGFIGAIQGHESLLDVGILHRDVSIGNIMLSENEENGFLIDLDLAVKINDDKASGAPSKTGTKVFMSIGILHGEHHNFMHDLESFFWVLLWICIHHDGLNANGKMKSRVISRFEKWNYAPAEELEILKIGEISDAEVFDNNTATFTTYCKPLIPCMKELREVVFPGGKRWRSEDQRLYSQMNAVLTKAKEDMKHSRKE